MKTKVNNFLFVFLVVLLFVIKKSCFSQITCNPQGNIFLYSNYDGGVLNINVDVNIPNIKIGVVSYEMVTINLTGPFVNNITEVRFAGYTTTNHHHCNNSPAVTSIVGAPPGTDTIIFIPPVTLSNPGGYGFIICNYACDSVGNQGGCNTADQVADYFIQNFGGTLRYHLTQYGCWTGSHNASNGGNCCIGSLPPSPLPVSNFMSSDTVFCEKECIDFTDLSTNSPTSWQWTFTGATPANSTLQNPTGICYNNYGVFDVSLIACNSAGCDTLSYQNFIQEFPNPKDSIWNINDTLYSLPATSYQWFNTVTGLVPGAIDSFFVPTVSGSYYCVITDSIGCMGASDTINVIGTGFNILTGKSFCNIFPNPSENLFHVDIKTEVNVNTFFELSDHTGRLIMKLPVKQKRFSLNIDDPGFYFLTVHHNGSQMVSKIIKL